MLFWLTFIQTLPTVSTSELSQLELSDQSSAQSPNEFTVAQAIPTLPLTPTVGQLGGILFFPGLIAGLVILLLLAIWAYTRVYKITPNNEAFVRTGGVFVKRKTVVLNGGCVVLPGFHELTRVPLREISIDVERAGKLAVRTKDYMRADMRATFYVCITASDEDVLTAAARLSQGNRITPEDIKNALEKRADDAIRAAAKTKNLAEIDSDKLGFAQEVLNLMQPDLAKVGLTLNNIAVSEIQESDTYDTNNFFDAQGVRLRTETIQKSIQQKREVELVTRVAIEQKELDAEKRSLQITQEKETARLEQNFQVEALKAQREREVEEAKAKESAAIQRAKILQEQSVEEEEIRRQLSVKQSQINADIALEEQQKKLRVSQALQQQETELADITRQKTVDSQRLESLVQVAESERLAKVAQEDAAIAIATKRKESLEAEAERARAESAVTTATELEVAGRQRELAIIVAQRTAEERRIADQNVVEIDVFRRRRQAEIAKQAAELEADALRTLADANRDKSLAEAEGLQALYTAQNLINNANLTAQTFTTIWPQLAERLPEVLQALSPQPGVLGDARIYAFPGANGNGGAPDVSKLMFSTSGLALINTLLEDGKLSQLIGQVASAMRDPQAPVVTQGVVPVPPPPIQVDVES